MNKIILIIATCFCSTTLHAIDQQWSNVKIRYNEYSYDGESKTILGRYEFIDNFYVMGDYLEHQMRYDWAIYDFTNQTTIPVHVTRDYRSYSVGLGAYYDITDTISVNIEYERLKQDDFEYFVQAEEGYFLNPCPNYVACNTITQETVKRDLEFYNSYLEAKANWAVTDSLVLSAGLSKVRDRDERSWDTPFYRELGVLYFVTPELGLEYIRVEANGSDFHIDRFSLVYAF